MYVIRLPNGNLRVPHSVITSIAMTGNAITDNESTGQIIAQGYIEIGPDDPEYSRLAGEALTEEELAEKRRGWAEDDDALLREFEEWKAKQAGE
jgi:hypothetical protein